MLTELIARGGPVMYALLACSLLALAIVLERFWFWILESKRTPKKKLKNILARTSNEDALEGNPLFEKIHTELEQGDLETLSRTLQKESERSYERSIKHLVGLDTVVSIAPLLGILGTVLGIMKSFHALDLQHMSSPGEVGHGLAEAMITTATGLAIAVPALVFYNLFLSMAAKHAAELFKMSEDVKEDL